MLKVTIMNRSIFSHSWIAGLGLIGGMFFSSSASAQILGPEDDGIVPRAELHPEHTAPIPYPFLRQDDIMWSTRQWERIDVREKINHPLYYPVQPLPDRKSLFDVLVDAIVTEGSITEVFRDDRFTRPLTNDEISQLVSSNDTIRDPDDPSKILFIDELKIKAPDVVAWELKSDWYFDKQRGEMKNRIIGISPVVKDIKIKTTTYNLFWIWFPDARPALATHVAYNPLNNQQRLTFDQIFHKRQFSSVIYKEDNTYDREIKDYKRNIAMDMLLESQRIRENLRAYEHDLWEF